MTGGPTISIPGYEDFEIIGRGGMATVYRARQISVGRPVAIKVLSDPSPDADLVRRFERESKAVGALSWHPHIAAVVDAGTTADRRAFIVFELLTGGSLEDHLAVGPLPWTDAVTAMIQVADAVEAAHRADVLHRDIKPANILLNRLGDAKLADFGIASMQDGTSTEAGMLAATVAHAAPELFSGEPASVATDVYALGSTLHTLVVGHPPFVADPAEPIASVIGRATADLPPTPDPQLVPGAVAKVIARALAKSPAERPPTAAAFGRELQRVQREGGIGVTSMPVGDSQILNPAGSAPSPGSADHVTHDAPVPQTDQPAPGSPQTDQPAPGSPQTDQPAPGSPQTDQPAPGSPQAAGSVAPGAETFPTLDNPKPFGRTLVALATLAVLAAGALGVAIAVRASTESEPLPPVAVTLGGAEVVSYKATPQTALNGSPAGAALDGDPDTFWGVAASDDGTHHIIGTTYTIRLAAPMFIERVGITNGESERLGRVSELLWATSVDELRAGDVVRQAVDNEPGDHTIEFGIVTDQVAVAIADLHDHGATEAGIAELLMTASAP